MTIGGETAAIIPGSDTGTQITVTSPSAASGTPGIVGTVDVIVTTPGGTSATSSLDQFTGISPPSVTSIVSQGAASVGSTGSIPAGPVSGGSEVLINGTGLDGATAVYFGTTEGTIVTDAGTYILADSPQARGRSG